MSGLLSKATAAEEAAQPEPVEQEVKVKAEQVNTLKENYFYQDIK